MPLLQTKVVDFSNFGKINDAVVDLAREVVTEAAKEGGTVAAAVASQRRQSGQMANIRIGSATETHDGFVASFVSPVHYAWMQNYGTLGNRRKALKQAPRTDRSRAPGTGVQPLRFLNIGARAGVAKMRAIVQRGIR